jgi:hypothetical protein
MSSLDLRRSSRIDLAGVPASPCSGQGEKNKDKDLEEWFGGQDGVCSPTSFRVLVLVFRSRGIFVVASNHHLVLLSGNGFVPITI